MTNGEKFKETFSITQVDDCDLSVYAWLPNHDAIEIPPEWWNAEYKEPKTGHWIDEFGGCECSECGYLEPGYSDYCPNCGARMAEPQESEV